MILDSIYIHIIFNNLVLLNLISVIFEIISYFFEYRTIIQRLKSNSIKYHMLTSKLKIKSFSVRFMYYVFMYLNIFLI